jgi:hypothetical protein
MHGLASSFAVAAYNAPANECGARKTDKENMLNLDSLRTLALKS